MTLVENLFQTERAKMVNPENVRWWENWKRY